MCREGALGVLTPHIKCVELSRRLKQNQKQRAIITYFRKNRHNAQADKADQTYT